MAEPPILTSTERLWAARYPLAASAAVLALACWFFALPVPFAATALVIIAVAALAPAGFRGRQQSAAAATPTRSNPAVAAVLSALPRPAFVLDPTGVVRFANGEAARHFGATRPGDPFTLTFRSPEIRSALQLADSAPVVEYREPGRPNRVCSIAFTPLRVPDETEPGVLVTIDDASDRLAISRMRADFVANASHELRTPLASLTGFIETLLGPARNDPEAAERFLRIMQEQAGRMRRLIDDLLSLSRVEMRQHRRPTERIDVMAVLSEAVDIVVPMAVEHAVELTLQASEAPAIVLGDRDELLQVFSNLLENAVRYGASGKNVEVSAELRREGPRPALAIHVQDYGPGIAEEHLPRLTERFYRVDVGASREMKGTGLGLAIVKHILTRHEARLQIESRPGAGARFTVLLPLAGAPGDTTENTTSVQ